MTGKDLIYWLILISVSLILFFGGCYAVVETAGQFSQRTFNSLYFTNDSCSYYGDIKEMGEICVSYMRLIEVDEK